jgi:hypothetical protein
VGWCWVSPDSRPSPAHQKTHICQRQQMWGTPGTRLALNRVWGQVFSVLLRRAFTISGSLANRAVERIQRL